MIWRVVARLTCCLPRRPADIEPGIACAVRWLRCDDLTPESVFFSESVFLKKRWGLDIIIAVTTAAQTDVPVGCGSDVVSGVSGVTFTGFSSCPPAVCTRSCPRCWRSERSRGMVEQRTGASTLNRTYWRWSLRAHTRFPLRGTMGKPSVHEAVTASRFFTIGHCVCQKWDHLSRKVSPSAVIRSDNMSLRRIFPS